MPETSQKQKERIFRRLESKLKAYGSWGRTGKTVGGSFVLGPFTLHDSMFCNTIEYKNNQGIIDHTNINFPWDIALDLCREYN